MSHEASYLTERFQPKGEVSASFAKDPDWLTEPERVSFEWLNNVIAFSEPITGQVCCCQFSEDNQWYRARVVSVHSPSNPLQFPTLENKLHVEVMYIDYGNNEWVPLSRYAQSHIWLALYSGWISNKHVLKQRIKGILSAFGKRETYYSCHFLRAQAWCYPTLRDFRIAVFLILSIPVP